MRVPIKPVHEQHESCYQCIPSQVIQRSFFKGNVGVIKEKDAIPSLSNVESRSDELLQFHKF